MQKIKIGASILALCLTLTMSLSAQTAAMVDSTKKVSMMADTAKSSANYFLGKWSMQVFGTPQGDLTMPAIFEMKKDSVSKKEEMVGRFEKTKDAEAIIFSKVEPSDTSITFYFRAQGYDLNMTLDKKDKDNAAGRMFDMFDAKAVRVKE